MHGEKEKGQAMVEFSLVVGLFLLCLLGAVSASLYTVQRTAAVTAVAAGARTAAGGTQGPTGANSPDLADATPTVSRVIAPVMAGTHINQLKPSQDCRPERAIPHAEIDVCTTLTGDMVEPDTLVRVERNAVTIATAPEGLAAAAQQWAAAECAPDVEEVGARLDFGEGGPHRPAWLRHPASSRSTSWRML